MVGGRDRSNQSFTRVDPCAVTPVVADIFLSDVDNIVVDVGYSAEVKTFLKFCVTFS